MSPKNKSDDFDITRIEDQVPFEHPPLPSLPDDTPDFSNAKLPPETPSEFPASPNELFEPADNFSSLTQPSQVEELSTFEKDQDLPEQSKSEEIFKDVKDELETFVHKHVPFESYPSFSLYLSDIKFGRQRNTIKLMLKEYNLLQSEQELELVERSLNLKHLLIPRISEFAAIFFANKLEHLGIKIQIAPSEDYSNSHELWDQGPVTEESFHHHKEENAIILPEIFLSQAYSINYKSITLLGEVLQQSLIIAKKDLTLSPTHFNLFAQASNNFLEIKNQAREKKANAVVGLNFQQIEYDDQDAVLILVTGEAAIIKDDEN